MINEEAVEAALAALGEAYGEDAYCKEREYVITTLEAALPFLASTAPSAPVRVSQELLDEQRAGGWKDWHPEDYCHRCYETNVSWYVDSPAWSDVMRGGNPEGWGLWQEIICMPCFTGLADAHYGTTQAWTITRDRSSYHLSRRSDHP